MINSSQIEKKKKYTKLLNNLLDIKRGDSSILTKTSTKNFDLFVMFKNNLEILKKIFENKTFILEITTDSISNLIEELTNLLLSYEAYEDKLLFVQEVKLICEQYDFHLKKVFENGLIIEKEIKITLEKIINNLQIEKQQFVKKWMKYKKEINDEIDQKGISPLYIGTCFLKGTDLNEFYAFNGPLFLKEINIEIQKSKIKISSNSDWIINEKLIFYLERMGYFVLNSMSYEEKDILELMRDVLSSIKIEVPENILFFYQEIYKF